MVLTPYCADRACEIAELYCCAVHAIDSSIYSEAQKAAWAPVPPDYTFWAARLAVKQPWLVIIDNRVAGFIELDPDGHIDCTYVHPDYQGKGVAACLYRHLETIAIGRGMLRLFVEASEVARPFFKRMGFAMVRENAVKRHGMILNNYTMEKYLSGVRSAGRGPG